MQELNDRKKDLEDMDIALRARDSAIREKEGALRDKEAAIWDKEAAIRDKETAVQVSSVKRDGQLDYYGPSSESFRPLPVLLTTVRPARPRYGARQPPLSSKLLNGRWCLSPSRKGQHWTRSWRPSPRSSVPTSAHSG